MQSLLWTFPAIMGASIVIGWAAELAALHISAGLALAILALLQTLPEFGVEAFIAWQGNTHLMLANLTGSLRLFVGLGWPMVFFIHAFCERFGRRRSKTWPRFVGMPKTFAVEATFLILPVFYFMWLGVRRNITFYDGIVLCAMYIGYLGLLNYQRLYLKHHSFQELDEEEEDMEFIPRKIAERSRSVQRMAMALMFVLGGTLLFVSIHPFVEGLKVAAVALGMTEFVFIQWVAPFASEFPEKITAFGWARKASKVPMAIFNMVSSSVNQWTLLAGFVPIVYCLGRGSAVTVEFDQFQHTEIMLTVAQSVLGILYLSDLKFRWYEALTLFVLWLIQFAVPSTREVMLAVYVALSLAAVFRILFMRRMPVAWVQFAHLVGWILKRFVRVASK